ncbi:Transmembrane protein Tmp21 [Auxenochlorella protothecoides]|nr:Transmembrane protein Tmp21 [Auxenochlorella protothecoides]KFM26437.1 Transmembrane protein Tmp21 [Auxenochlorella protothecoides]
MVFQTKCVMEEVVEGTEITGSFTAFNRHQPSELVHVDIRIDNPAGTLLHEEHGVSGGHFHLLDTKDGDHKVCFTASDFQTAQNTRIRVEWKSGASAHDWEQVAKKDNLNFLQTELLSLEQSVHDIHIELQRIRRKEEEMRDINEATNARVAWLGVGALLVCLGLSGWQMSYLQRFFKRKKLL